MFFQLFLNQDILSRYWVKYLLKTAMFLVGASNIEELKQKRLIITGKTREILTELNIDTKKYARRI